MDQKGGMPRYDVLAPVVVTIAVVVLAVWLGTMKGGGPLELERRSARYSTEWAAFAGELDARLASLEERWDTDGKADLYRAVRDLREGFRSLLRSAAGEVAGASVTAYSPEAERLVAELESEYADRAATLAAALPPAEREALLSGAHALEEQLTQVMRLVRSEGGAAARPAFDDFRAIYRQWRQASAFNATPAATTP
ncbi:hypothetical protein HS125_20305 [bacterium]|nr:hypothetical protein [bacterium]